MVSYAWGNMQNGSTGLEALCVSVRGIKLFQPAAVAVEAMAQAFEARFGKRLQFTEGFRPIGRPGDWENGNANTQWYYYERWLSNKARYPNGAYPGGSIHGWGKAVDVNLTGRTGEQIEWLHTEGRVYGFNWDTTGRLIDEPWHLDFNLPVTANISQEEEDMPLNDADKQWITTTIRDTVNNLFKDLPDGQTSEAINNIRGGAVVRGFQEPFDSDWLKDAEGHPQRTSIRGLVDATRNIVGDIKNKLGA